MARRPEKNRRGKDRPPKRLFKQDRGPAVPRFEPGRGPAVPPGAKVLYSPKGKEKMSEVLEDFVGPYRDPAAPEHAYRALLHLGLLAWNAALLPEVERWAGIDQVLAEGFPGTSRADHLEIRGVVEDMVARKLEHFAENRRMIFSFELVDQGDDLQLYVVSSL